MTRDGPNTNRATCNMKNKKVNHGIGGGTIRACLHSDNNIGSA